ncbi:hypothetical protein MTR_0088s0110 [Medicago truncatula]|uniref:Retrovirus-related Pol polyprotein from transposon TNT 1-94-like beta-barrel domain-containing protein n=1 Tax=Medicago truncatula TaxID=3880 RepID=A0A072TTF0_MEDTR|nr:hypothetical protein MTR_0088s0110 [Medicago truncatula]
MKTLWEELASHRPIPSCVCIHILRCEASTFAKTHRNEDQIMQFLTCLNDQFSIVKTQVLLLDPGANEHVCCNLSCYSFFYRIKLVHVSLSNRNSILVHYGGTISFTSHIYLSHVLYSPTFTLHLISVAKLCQSLFCSLQFSLDHFLIKDKMSLKMIGLAKQPDGL